MIFYKGNGKKECELSKSQLCPARSNRRPLLVRLSLYLPFPAAFPRKFPFSFSFRIFYLPIFCFIPVGFFLPCNFAHFFFCNPGIYILPFRFAFFQQMFSVFFLWLQYFHLSPPPELTDVLCACMKKTHYFCFIYWSHIAIALISRWRLNKERKQRTDWIAFPGIRRQPIKIEMWHKSNLQSQKSSTVCVRNPILWHDKIGISKSYIQVWAQFNMPVWPKPMFEIGI